MAPLLLETATSHRKLESREMSVTGLELKSLLLRKQRDGRQLGRTELNWLCRAIWRKRRALERETSEQDQGKCRDGERPQENTKQAFQLEFDCETRKPRKSAHRLLPRPLVSPDGPRRCHPIRETPLGSTWRNLRLDCTGGLLISPKKLERALKALPPEESGRAGEIVVDDVLGCVLPGRLAVFFDGNGPESGWLLCRCLLRK